MLQSTFEDLPDEAKKSYYDLSNRNFEERIAPEKRVGVAYGDSWFDYIPAFFEDVVNGDLLGHLNRNYPYNIYRRAKPGDTLENMTYGTDVDDSGDPMPQELLHALEAVKRYQPAFFLISAGGNDIAGDNGVNLEKLLNHAETQLPPLRENWAIKILRKFNHAMLEYLITRIKRAKPDIEIFIHGYDYAIPDGRAVVTIPPNWKFIGPWLLPAFERKPTCPFTARQQVIDQLIDMHNQTIAELASADRHVHHIDCRGVLRRNRDDWANELHPRANGFGKIAAKFDQVIQSVFHQRIAPVTPGLPPSNGLIR